MADDEDVVFRDSMLYGHLKAAGYCDGDIDAAEKNCEEEGTGEDDAEEHEHYEEENSMPQATVKRTVWIQLKEALLSLVWDDGCRKEVNQLHAKEAESLTDSVLQCPLLEDEDAAYIDSFAASIDTGAKTDDMEESDGVMTQVITQMGILGISLAYGCFRMVYMKSSEENSDFMIWILDIFAILLTAACLMPFTIRFAWAGRLIRKLRTFNNISSSLILNLSLWDKLSRRTVRLIQEMELVSKGFTMVNHLAPASRLENSSQQSRQCPQLRLKAFLSARSLMLQIKSASQQILLNFPGHVDLEGSSQFLANTPLKEYGSCVNTPEGDELYKLTDAYCLSAIKEMISLCNTHISEFLRLMSLACLLRSDVSFHNLGFIDQLSALKVLHKQLSECTSSVHQVYRLHKYLIDKENEHEHKERKKQTPLSALHVAVHSLNLHLQAALMKVQPAEDHLSSKEDSGLETLTPKLCTELGTSFDVIGREIEACKDCLDEASKRIHQGAGKTDAPPPYAAQSASTDGGDNDRPPPIPLDDIEPIIRDQVFEAYTDPNEVDMDSFDDDFLSKEEKAQRKAAQQDAVRILKELRSVIAVRAEDRLEREKKAIEEANAERGIETREGCDTDMPDILSNSTKADVPCTFSDSAKEFEADLGRKLSNDEDIDSDNDELIPPPHMEDLKSKLSGFSFSQDLAAMAAARSSLLERKEETFGGSGEMETSDSEQTE